MDASAFTGCTALTALQLPASLKLQDWSPFAGCPVKEVTAVQAALVRHLIAVHGIHGIAVRTAVDCKGDGETVPIASAPASPPPPSSKKASAAPVLFHMENGVLLSLDEEKCRPRQNVLYLPEGITAIGENAFKHTFWDTIVVPEGCRELQKSAFENCNAKAILLPPSIRVIGESAFAWCNFLKEITIPEGVQALPRDVFHMCSDLTELHLPASLKSLSRPEDTNALQHMEIAPENPYLQTDGKALLSKDGKTLFWLLKDVSGDYRVPDGVSEIAAHAFQKCKELTSVTMPDSVSTIGKGAFEYCANLTSLHFSDRVEILEDDLCFACTALKEVHFPAALKKIQEFAFIETALQRVDLPEGLTYIGRGSLNIPPLEELVIPSTLYEIFHNAVAFTHLKKLVYRPKSPFGITCATAVKNEVTEEPGQIDEIVLENVPLKRVEDLPNALLAPICRGYLRQVQAGKPLSEELMKWIGKMAHRAKWDFWADPEIGPFLVEHNLLPLMDYLEAMDGILAPETVTGTPLIEQLLEYHKRFPANRLIAAREKYAASKPFISYPTDLTAGEARKRFFWKTQKNGTLVITGYKGWELEVEIPETIEGVPVTAIGDDAFSAVDKTISEWQREMRRNITDICCPNSIVWIGNRAFYHCTSLNMIAFDDESPIALRWLGAAAFAGCTHFDIGCIPWGTRTIQPCCFDGCQTAEVADLDGTVGTIGPYTFRNCTKLKEVSLYEGITEVDSDAFDHCTSLESIRLPKSLNLTDWTPFEHCPIQRVYAPKGSKAAKLAAAQGIRVVQL